MISRRTQIALREALGGFTLHEITDLFDSAGLQPRTDHEPRISGQRRRLVEQYYANIDSSAATDAENLLHVCSDVVRENRYSVDQLLAALRQDGYKWVDDQFAPTGILMADRIAEFAQVRNLSELTRQVTRLANAVDSDPPLAVGSAKDMVESVCKTILGELKIPIGNETLPQLVKVAGKQLGLAPADIPNQAKGKDAIVRVLSGLGQIVNGMAQLRNLYGTGHGRAGGVTGGVTARHARLAVGAAASLATFLLETHVKQLGQRRHRVAADENGTTKPASE